jgi:hypothetical protein
MAINNKPSVPAPAIFSSDPLEQIAMRGIGDDPKKSGLMYMFLNAFGEKRNMDQAAYMAGVEKANQQSMILGQKELEQAKHEQMLKAAVDLAKLGGDVNAMPHTAELFKNGSAATLQPDLMRSQIHKNMQEGKGGDGGGKLKVKADVGPGATGFYSIEGTGPDALARVRAQELELLRQRGQTPKQVIDPNDAAAYGRYRQNQNQGN